MINRFHGYWIKWLFSKMSAHAFFEKNEDILRYLQVAQEESRDGWLRRDQITYGLAKERERQLVAKRKLIEQHIAPYDTGSAGDAAEEAWADELRSILPTYNIIVKGVIVSDDLKLSPQIDILVIDKNCPKEIYQLKTIPIEAVVAAFECKLNLRTEDIYKSIETSNILKEASRKSIMRNRSKDIVSSVPIFYGILALGSAINNKIKSPCNTIIDAMKRSALTVNNPINMLDVIVVPEEYCFAARPRIFCFDIKNAPHDMLFCEDYLIHGGNPIKSTPSDNSIGLFRHKLFSHLSKINYQLNTYAEMYELFVCYLSEEETISGTSLDKLMPLDCIQRIAQKKYGSGREDGSTIFDFDI